MCPDYRPCEPSPARCRYGPGRWGVHTGGIKARGEAMTSSGNVVVGVRAPWWAERCSRATETVIREDMSDVTAEELARFLSRSHMDPGAVDFWHDVGGHTEVRDAGGVLVAAYIDGHRFTAEQWKART